MKSYKEDIIHWINKFKELHPKEIEDTFLFGDCYWFAVILSSAFENSEIYYLPIDNHFIVKVYNGNSYFDITGEIFPEETPVYWQQYKLDYPTEAARIERDCIYWWKRGNTE